MFWGKKFWLIGTISWFQSWKRILLKEMILKLFRRDIEISTLQVAKKMALLFLEKYIYCSRRYFVL